MPILPLGTAIFRPRGHAREYTDRPEKDKRGSRLAGPDHGAQGTAIRGHSVLVPSWYRRFVPNLSTISRLIGKNARWQCGKSKDQAFRTSKQALTTAPVLACQDFCCPFTLQTDASTVSLGAILTQEFDEGERVIAYASRTLNPAERNYSATELECLAVVWGIRRIRDYLEEYRFTVITDHQSLKWLRRIESPSGRLSRWLCELQQYDFDVQYRRGALNQVADALSRKQEVCAVRQNITRR